MPRMLLVVFSFNQLSTTMEVPAITKPLMVVSASPIAYGFGLDVFRNRQGMRSSIWLWGWPSMIASRVSAM